MAETILIIDDDLDTLRLVGLMLQRQGYSILAASNGKQGLELAKDEDPDLILLDIMMPDMDGYEVARHLRQNPRTNHTPILMFTAKTQLDDKVTGFEAGADDYLTKPTHPAELQAHVKALLARSAKPRTPAPGSQDGRAYTIGVLSARGGMGVSSFATNLAASLYTRTKSDVITAELRSGQGTVALDLGISDPKGLTELLASNTVQITKQRVREQLITHISGIQLLPASHHPKDSQLATAIGQHEAIVSRLGTLSRFLILDLGPGLPPVTQKLLMLCNEVVVLTEPVLGSIIHTRSLVDDLRGLGVDGSKISVVLVNRSTAEPYIQASQIKEKLGYPIAAEFSAAPDLFFQATRMQTPAVICQPDSPTSMQFASIAEHFINNASS